MTSAVGDTGLWRLTVEISEGRMRAWLRQIAEAGAKMQPIADVRWSDDQYLHNVENAVYDNPSVLDDFEADIIITSERYMFLPDTLGADTSLCRTAYAQIYGEVEAEDVMVSCNGAYSCVCMPVAGLRSFLARTFSGARISSHISRLVSYWQSVAGSGLWLYVSAADGHADIVALNNTHLVVAVTKVYEQAADLLYHIVCVAHSVCGKDLTPLSVGIDAREELTASLIEMLSGTVREAAPVITPGRGEDVPLAARICGYRKTNSKL